MLTITTTNAYITLHSICDGEYYVVDLSNIDYVFFENEEFAFVMLKSGDKIQCYLTHSEYIKILTGEIK